MNPLWSDRKTRLCYQSNIYSSSPVFVLNVSFTPPPFRNPYSFPPLNNTVYKYTRLVIPTTEKTFLDIICDRQGCLHCLRFCPKSFCDVAYYYVLSCRHKFSIIYIYVFFFHLSNSTRVPNKGIVEGSEETKKEFPGEQQREVDKIERCKKWIKK